MDDSRGCIYNGKPYSEGSHICQAGREYECAGGRWSDTGRDCPSLEGDWTEIQIVEGKRAIGKIGIQSSCLNLVFNPEAGRVILHNSCSDRKKATIGYRKGTVTWTTQYYVGGATYLYLELGAEAAWLIKEE